MTAYLQYYRLEDERHAAVLAITVKPEVMVKMTKALCRHFKVPMLKIRFLSKTKTLGAGKSWVYDSEVVYHPLMMNPLTVAHEVAHHVEENLMATVGQRPYHFHGKRHRLLTDEGVEVLKRRKEFSSSFAGKIKVLRVPLNSEGFDLLAEGFYLRLPERAICPCCKAFQLKSMFGVRVTKRDSYGRPVVVQRQSYCKACR